MNPRIIDLHVKAHSEEIKEKDYLMWLQGRYMHDAFMVGLSHFGASFGKKKSEAKYPEKPYMEEAKTQKEEENVMTDEEREQMAKNYMLKLQILGSNFERANKKKE